MDSNSTINLEEENKRLLKQLEEANTLLHRSAIILEQMQQQVFDDISDLKKQIADIKNKGLTDVPLNSVNNKESKNIDNDRVPNTEKEATNSVDNSREKKDPRIEYLWGLNLLSQKQYEKAINAFSDLNGFSDSDYMVAKSHYEWGNELLDAGQCEVALIHFEDAVLKFQDAKEKIIECRYAIAHGLLKKQLYTEACKAFSSLNGYRDSVEMEKCAKYLIVRSMLAQRSFNEALTLIDELGSYKDVKIEYYIAMYQYGVELLEQKEYIDAEETFSSLNGYMNSTDMAKEAIYLHAIELIEQEDLQTANKELLRIKEYKDAEELIYQCKYRRAKIYLKRKQYLKALEIAEEISCKNVDSTELLKQCKYEYAESLYKSKDYNQAMEFFIELGDYLDADDWIDKCKIEIARQYVVGWKYGDAIRVLDSIGGSKEKVTLRKNAYKSLLNLITPSFNNDSIRFVFRSKSQ